MDRLENSSSVSKFKKIILLSKSARPLSKIDMTVKVFCFGKFPIIVSTPDDDIIEMLSPISKSRLKLSSFPIEMKFFFNFLVSPTKFLLLINSSFEKSSLR